MNNFFIIDKNSLSLQGASRNVETRNVRHSNCDKKRNFPGIANLNERQRRLFYAKMALDMGRHGVKEVCKEYGVSKNTVYRGIHELKGNHNMESDQA